MDSEILTEIIKVVKECGTTILGTSYDNLGTKEKSSHRDVVTKYDIENQERIIKHLSKRFPNSGFISEEIEDNTFPSNELAFIIDPIDGTMNFTKDMGYSCVSVACFKNQKPYV